MEGIYFTPEGRKTKDEKKAAVFATKAEAHDFAVRCLLRRTKDKEKL